MTKRLIIQCLSLANCILFCASLLHAQVPSAGKLLVSVKGMGDENFAETVVLITTYNSRGAVGLILNQPSDIPLSQAWPGKKAAGALSFGGPVETFRVVALHQTKTSMKSKSALEVLPGLYFLNEKQDIEQAIKQSPEHVRLFAGYSGWAPGQLDFELKLPAWHVLDGTTQLAFDSAPETLWKRLIRKTQTFTAWNLLTPGH